MTNTVDTETLKGYFSGPLDGVAPPAKMTARELELSKQAKTPNRPPAEYQVVRDGAERHAKARANAVAIRLINHAKDTNSADD